MCQSEIATPARAPSLGRAQAWVAATWASKATPSVGRLCPAMTPGDDLTRATKICDARHMPL
jgi:hypothetical protein